MARRTKVDPLAPVVASPAASWMPRGYRATVHVEGGRPAFTLIAADGVEVGTAAIFDRVERAYLRLAVWAWADLNRHELAQSLRREGAH